MNFVQILLVLVVFIILIICLYCGVGCGVMVLFKDDGCIGVQGDVQYFVNFGCLCVKGLVFVEMVDLDGCLLYL